MSRPADRDTTYEVYALVCERCGAGFLVVDTEEQRGGHNKLAMLEANPCAACGKGQVERLGKVTVTPWSD